jgi:type I restriction enzyme S subunit
MRLGSIVDRLTNGFVGPTRDIYREQGVPYLLARHVRNNSLVFDGRTYVDAAFNEKNRKSKLKVGDVLLVQSGHIGHSAVVPAEHEGHNCHAMIVISAKPDILTGEYLSAVFNTARFRAKFQEIRTGSTVPHLTCGMVKELMIPVPRFERQSEVCAVLSSAKMEIDDLADAYSKRIHKLDTLRQSLLQKAFSGELT